MIGILIQLFMFTFNQLEITNGNEIIVRLNSGDLRGEVMTDENGNNFYSFRGIPFAEPPVGNLRFRAPVPKAPWYTILDAKEDGPACPQLDLATKQISGEEDNCLTLNVYTPKIPKHGKYLKYHVVVYVHGGGFVSGSGSSFRFGPRRFMQKEKDVILVTVTYRVGILGFLSTMDSSSPGNYGLLDQLQALRWVSNNIDRFGGDPKRVTLFGESAGAASVLYHVLSPLSKGLFYRVIAFSGSPLASWALQQQPGYWARTLAEKLNCPEESSELVDCLRKKDAAMIIEKGQPVINGDIHLAFVPSVDGYFLTDSPYNIVEKQEYNHVSLLMGTTRDEGDCWFPGIKSDDIYSEQDILDKLKTTVAIIPDSDKAVKLVKNKYFPSITSVKGDQFRRTLGHIITDGFFHQPLYHIVNLLTKGKTRPYVYFYDYNGWSKVLQELFNITEKLGVCHTHDLIMFFNRHSYGAKELDGENLKIKIKFQKLIFNFIRHGNPNDDMQNFWPASGPNHIDVYHIDEQNSITTFDGTKDQTYDFWVNQLPKAYENSQS